MAAAIRKLLCKVGIHQWVDTYQGPWDGWSQHIARECECCGKSEGFMLINPISGPRSKSSKAKGR